MSDEQSRARGASFLDARARAQAGDDCVWPPPQPIASRLQPRPYPFDALPTIVREAVGEVYRFVKAPLPLVAASALGAISTVVQSLVDVQRTDKLRGPTSLYLLTIADSGERKSTCDGFFTCAIRDWQEEQDVTAKSSMAEYKAAMVVWEAKKNGLLAKIAEMTKANKPTDELDQSLKFLYEEEPTSPRLPRLLLGDETPENLGYNLAKRWPAGAMITSEAGLILGAHGMGKDTRMIYLSLLNMLWDGGTHAVGRKSSDSYVVRGARLTLCLQVQEATLREFSDKSGGLARGTGFFARFLLSRPASTQGQRPYSDPPTNWPYLARFNRRIAELLRVPAPMGADGALSPRLMVLSQEAKEAWILLHDAIERELGENGDYREVGDVASKIADNAARLAALFQVMERGLGDVVELDMFAAATSVVFWHLHEARLYFGEMQQSREYVDAARLDGWLIRRCQLKKTHIISTREVLQFSPVRDRERLHAALSVLDEHDRMRLWIDGRKRLIRVNPALLGGAEG
jgi:putative DNA primase/helicase